MNGHGDNIGIKGKQNPGIVENVIHALCLWEK